MNRDKRASLSSGLLGLKDAAPSTEDGTTSAGSAASSDTAKAESRANVLYTKGAASASGFRPDQWSFASPAASAPSPAAAAPAEPPRLVMPFPAKAIAPVAPMPARPARAPMLALAGVAAVACVAIAVVAWPHRASHIPVATLPLPPAPLSPPFAAPPSAPVVAAVPDAASATEIAALMARADQLLATGDIVAARGFYEHAAEQGTAAAMTAVGKTYDPLFLEEMHVRGSRGDAGKAAEWYRRAGAAGDREAGQRLKRLIARYAG